MAEKTVLTPRDLAMEDVVTGDACQEYADAWERQVAELEAKIAELDAALRIVTVAADKVVGV